MDENAKVYSVSLRGGIGMDFSQRSLLEEFAN